MAGDRTPQDAPPASESRSGSPLAGGPLPAPRRPLTAAGWDAIALCTGLLLWAASRLVWETTVHANLDSYDVISVGRNPQGFSTAVPLFTGTIRQATLPPAAKLELLQRALAASRPEAATQD